jgi:hypothetical protein
VSELRDADVDATGVLAQVALFFGRVGMPALWQSQSIEKARDGDCELRRAAKVAGASPLLAILALSEWLAIPALCQRAAVAQVSGKEN